MPRIEPLIDPSAFNPNFIRSGAGHQRGVPQSEQTPEHQGYYYASGGNVNSVPHFVVQPCGVAQRTDRAALEAELDRLEAKGIKTPWYFFVAAPTETGDDGLFLFSNVLAATTGRLDPTRHTNAPYLIPPLSGIVEYLIETPVGGNFIANVGDSTNLSHGFPRRLAGVRSPHLDITTHIPVVVQREAEPISGETPYAIAVGGLLATLKTMKAKQPKRPRYEHPNLELAAIEDMIESLQTVMPSDTEQP